MLEYYLFFTTLNEVSMSAFNAFVEFVAKIIAQPLSKKNTTLSGITLHKSPEVKMVTKNIE